MSAHTHPALSAFHPAVAAWFSATFGEPSPPQAMGWPAIAAGKNVLLLAPTGSGKTLAAFLQCISNLYNRMEAGEDLDGGTQVLYISPLKALNNDIYRNLELPLKGIAGRAAELGRELPPLRVGLRTGDTTPEQRRAMVRRPPHILITTPESLFLMLASKARTTLSQVQYVIVDEIHALYPTKRGVHLALSLEHLEAFAGHPFQRIGLSATQRPLEEVAAFLGGSARTRGGALRPRPVEVIDTGQRKQLDLRIELPVDDLRSLPEGSIWPSVYGQVLNMVRDHRSTLVFVNNRRLAERLTARLNEMAGSDVARTHHGSLSKEQRLEVEDLLKSGRLSCIVATSSLELGIDVGTIDLVVQIESPGGVARGLQRVGRAGHLVGMPSKGRIVPKTRGDLLECAALAREMKSGVVEEAHAPQNCLDVLAQQVVGMTCVDGRSVNELYEMVTCAYPYRNLPRSSFDSVLAMMAGGYDGGDFVELNPRLFWDRVNDRLRASDRGRHLAYTSSGTIPDRGYFGVYLAGATVRLGELDEEFVAERRVGERFVLGTSAWQIDEIRQDRVIVSPSGRGDAQIPFWKGEQSGRGYELGKRMGAFFEEAGSRLERDDFEEWAAAQCLLDGAGSRNLRAYLRAQVHSTGALPSDRRIIIEEFQDELGGWRVMLHSPFGERVHAALALLFRHQLIGRDGLEVETMHDDNGILFHCPGGQNAPALSFDELPRVRLEEVLAEMVRGTSLFAMQFRHNAARALLLPTGPHGQKRTPFWLARLRAADLLQVVTEYPDFPIVIETLRECLQQAFDVVGLSAVLEGVAQGAIAVQHCRHATPSPFTQSLQFSFFGTYMYAPDMPKGEKRFRALGLNREALRELLGAQQVRELLSPDEIARAAREAAGFAPHQTPRNVDEAHAWLLRYGEWRMDDPRRTPGAEDGLSAHLDALKQAGRVVLLQLQQNATPVQAWVAAEDAPLYLSVWDERCGILFPEGPSCFQPAPFKTGLERLVRRYARTHGPFTMAELAAHFGASEAVLQAQLAVLQAGGQVQSGEFSPGVADKEWCDVGVLQRIHRRSLARARREIEPRGAAEYAAFLARWQHVAGPGRGPEALADVLARLSGCWQGAAAWGGGVLPVRVPDYQDVWLDHLVGSGQFTWVARNAGSGMKLAFVQPGSAPVPADFAQTLADAGAACSAVRQALAQRGALFLAQIVQHTGLGVVAALDALEMLVASGEVTNDTLGPVRFYANRRPEHRQYAIGPAILSQMGRWSLMDQSATANAERLAETLLARYGLVTRDVAAQEGVSWAELGPLFDQWEAVGRVRRGYFVSGLAGMQYARPEAVDGLRLDPAEGLPEYWALLWRDPANPYSSLLDLPARPDTALQPDFVVLRRGEPVLLGGGKKIRLQSLVELDDEALSAAIGLLAPLAIRTRTGEGRLAVIEYDGKPVMETPAARALKEAGFERGYRQMERWM